jgi:tetratricopeptide (TPR) repeat protein
MIAGGIKDDLAEQAAMAIVEIDSKQGHLDEALKLLDQLQASSDVIDNPLQLDILAVRIGDGLLGKGERQKALRMYAIVRPKQVVMDLQKKRIESIGKTIEENTATLQKNPKAFMEVNATNARLKEDQKQLQTVLDQFEKMSDTEVPVRLRQAKAYDELDQKWETILIWESLLDSSKDLKVREDALFSIGSAYCSLGRPDDAVPALDRYIAEFPAGKYASQSGYLKGAVALEAGDFAKAETVFGTLIEKGDTSALAADMQFLLANSEFAEGADPKSPNPAKYKEAIEDYQKYLSKFSTGKFAEECTYRIPLCSFQLGDYGKALEGFQAYVKKYPDGTFTGDAGYRIALCYQAANKYDDVIRLCNEWLKKHQGEIMQAEILSLKGDAYAAKEMPVESAAAYRDSLNFAESEELFKYSLFEANKQYQKLNKWDDIAEMFGRFAERHPQHPAAVAAVYWVSKAKIKQGKPEEAKKYLAENILKNINDRRQDAVEMLLTQLAQVCSKRPRPPLISKESPVTTAPGATNPPVADAGAAPPPRPSATPLPPYDADGDFAKYLSETNAGEGVLAKARLRFALAQLASFTKRQEHQRELMASIYKDFPADQLSAMLLSECGQIGLERGETEKAEAFFKELMESFPKSDLLEYAYCGMGETALAKNQPAEAIKWFNDAVEKANADAKLADITYGKGSALLALGKFDEAKKIFEQVASTKDWRGEVTAKALMALGDLEEKRGKPDAALQYYQRVYVAYQRYPSVVIPAYLKAADAFVKMGKPGDAAKNLKDMLSKPRLASSPLAEQARKKLECLPPEPAPTASPASSPSPAKP